MKASKILDVDFIGGQDVLTKEEEIALHEYFSNKTSVKKPIKKRSTRNLKEKV